MKAVILTKSSMKAHGVSGVCTVAYDLDKNDLVRLVSNEAGGPIPNPICNRYDYLDIIDAPIIKPCPHPPQTENILISYAGINVIDHYADGIDSLFSLYQKNKIFSDSLFMDNHFNRLDDVSIYKHSVEMISVTNLTLSSNDTGKTVVSFRGENGRLYSYFRVTDPDYKNLQEESITMKKAFLIISIPYQEFITDTGESLGYYKFVAKIFRGI